MKYLHLRTYKNSFELSSFGGITLGWERDGEILKVVAAVCCNKDRFNKKRAHQICEGRMRKGKYMTFELLGQKPREFVYDNEELVETMKKFYNVDRD